MTIVSVFAVLFLTMLLGMIMNVGRQVDGKIRMQNAADAAAYSGGVMSARGMNALVFTNRLMCDVCALTAIMREARDQNAASYVPSILAAWTKAGQTFSRSGFPKFQSLGAAIAQEVPMEQATVDAFSQWAFATQAQLLPLLEEILSEELIPQYQRAVTQAFPDIAQQAALDAANLNGQPDYGRGQMAAALWRSAGQPVGGDTADASTRTLPVIDPEMDNMPDYVAAAQQRRNALAMQYLRQWNNQAMAGFDNYARMSQFGALWRAFTCGQLEKLLAEYATQNLPQMIRQPSGPGMPLSGLQQYYCFVGVVYWKKVPQLARRIFDNPASGDSEAFAEVHLFIPEPRLVWQEAGGGGGVPPPTPIGGVPGDFQTLPANPSPAPAGGGGGAVEWTVVREHLPTAWDLFDQRWTCQLAPATQPALATILQTPPRFPAGSNGESFTPPNLGALGEQDLEQINFH